MPDGNVNNENVIAIDDAPELGGRVELHEGTVGDALRLIEAQQAGVTGVRFTLEALSISLRVDGKRLSVDDLLALPVNCTNALLLRVGPRALDLNRFFPHVEGEDNPEAVPDDADPKG